MRYTKELQESVCEDIRYGLSPQECSEKWNVPISVILKWNNLSIPVERAKEIAIRKYQVEVSEAEADLMEKLSSCIDPNISDDEYLRISDKVSKSFYALSSKIIRKERDLNQNLDNGKNCDAKIILDISKKWYGNAFLDKYKK